MHEICLKLTESEILHYKFKATQIVEFHIHYHKKEQVFYPKFPEDLLSLNDSFKPQQNNSYCMTWLNRSKNPIGMTYSYNISEIK